LSRKRACRKKKQNQHYFHVCHPSPFVSHPLHRWRNRLCATAMTGEGTDL